MGNNEQWIRHKKYGYVGKLIGFKMPYENGDLYWYRYTDENGWQQGNDYLVNLEFITEEEVALWILSN